MNQFKTLALLALLSGLLVGVGYWVIGGSTGILVGLVMAAVSNLFATHPSTEERIKRLDRLAQQLMEPVMTSQP